jgi:hypothetical protein
VTQNHFCLFPRLVPSGTTPWAIINVFFQNTKAVSPGTLKLKIVSKTFFAGTNFLKHDGWSIMIKHTFSHIKGISSNFEKQLNDKGVFHWDDFFEKFMNSNPFQKVKLRKSKQNYFFHNKL